MNYKSFLYLNESHFEGVQKGDFPVVLNIHNREIVGDEQIFQVFLECSVYVLGFRDLLYRLQYEHLTKKYSFTDGPAVPLNFYPQCLRGYGKTIRKNTTLEIFSIYTFIANRRVSLPKLLKQVRHSNAAGALHRDVAALLW